MERAGGYTMKNFVVCTIRLNIVRVIKSRNLRWTGHVSRMQAGRSAFKILTGKPSKRDL